MSSMAERIVANTTCVRGLLGSCKGLTSSEAARGRSAVMSFEDWRFLLLHAEVALTGGQRFGQMLGDERRDESWP